VLLVRSLYCFCCHFTALVDIQAEDSLRLYRSARAAGTSVGHAERDLGRWSTDSAVGPQLVQLALLLPKWPSPAWLMLQIVALLAWPHPTAAQRQRIGGGGLADGRAWLMGGLLLALGGELSFGLLTRARLMELARPCA